MEKADVAASAEDRRFARTSCRQQHDRLDLGRVLPGLQQDGDVADHCERQGIQRFGPVQGDQAQAAIDLGVDLALGLQDGNQSGRHAWLRELGVETIGMAACEVIFRASNSLPIKAASTIAPPTRVEEDGSSPAPSPQHTKNDFEQTQQ